MTDQNKTQDTPIKLTLTIPVDGSGMVSMVGSKGDVSKIWQIAYGDQNDLAAAIHNAAWDLVNLEMAPPPRYDPPAMPGKNGKKTAESPVPAAADPGEPPITAAGDQAESEALDQALEASLAQEDESADEAPDDSEIEAEEAEIGGGVAKDWSQTSFVD